MGVICILLGIIAMIAFTGAGAVIGTQSIDFVKFLSVSLVALKDISDTNIMIGFIGVFAFFGILIGVGLITQGLTYNKVAKIQRRLRHKDS